MEDLLNHYDQVRLKDETAHQKGSTASDLDIHTIFGTSFRGRIERFFGAVETINDDILPELYDCSFRLVRYEKNMANKGIRVHVLLPIFLILFLGILLPVILSLKPMHSVRGTVVVLGLSVCPYIWVALYLLLLAL